MDERPAQLDADAVRRLTDLISAVTLRDEWSDHEFDAIFEGDVDPITIGIEATTLLICCGQDRDSPPDLLFAVRFFEWLADEGEDDWLSDEMPHCFAASTPDLALAWIGLIGDGVTSESLSSTIIERICNASKKDDAVSKAIRPAVGKALNDSRKLTVEATTDLMRLAVELRFAETADAIETAFSENRIDCGLMGDWESVRKELHVEGLGLAMPEKPYNSLDAFRLNIGMGVFSKEPLQLFGELKEDAVEQYLQTACNAFAQSKEFREVGGDDESPHYVRQFLELGIRYLGVTTDSMSVANAKELLLEIIPGNVSMEASEADRLFAEVWGFWKFCERVHSLERASAIAAEIKSHSQRFRRALNDHAKFGVAKSLFMPGQQAGFDMTSQEGLNEFKLANNTSISQSSGTSFLASSKSQLAQRSTSSDFVDSPPADSNAGSENPIPLDRKKRKKLLAKIVKSSKRSKR